MTSAIPEKIAAAHQSNIDNLMAIVTTTLASTERLAALNLEISRSLLEDTVSTAKTLLTIKNAKELTELKTSIAQPVAEKVITYSQHLYAITSQTKEELNKVFQSQLADIKGHVSSSMENAARNYPVGSDTAVAAVQSMVAAANAVYEKVADAAQKMTKVTEATVELAQVTAEKVAKTTKKPGKA